MTEEEWMESVDPTAMIRHLESCHCTIEFTLLAGEFFQRIQPEITDKTLLAFISTGGSPDIQESQEDAREQMIELGREAASLDFTDPRAQEINRQLEIAEAILIFDGQGFAETMLDLSMGIAALFEDLGAERDWQAQTIRRLYSFNYSPPDDETDNVG